MSIIYIPFGYILKLCCFLSANYYILALLFFTIIMQLLLFPLGIKQQKSQIKMAEIRPKETVIREKYKGRNDKVTQNKMAQEIQDLYAKEGYNQFAGCLPLLIQLPIIIILFGVVRQPLTYTVALGNENYDVKEMYITAGAIVREAENGFEEAKKQNPDKETEINNYITELQSLRNYFGFDENYKGVDNSSEYAPSTQDELILTKFAKYDYKAHYDEKLNEYGIEGAITTGFNKDDIDKIPKFGFISGYTFLDQPSNFIGFNILMLIPILVFLSSYLSPIITKKFTVQPVGPDGQPAGNGMMMKVGMPLMSAIFAFMVPGAIGIYWVYRSIISILQSYILSKMYPIPVTTKEDIDNARREMKNKKKKVIMIEVDEDDHTYDELTVKENKSDNNKKKIEMLSAETPDDNKVEKAPLKEDKDN